MAVKITGLLTPNSGSYVAEAKNIAFSKGDTAVTLQSELAELIAKVNNLPTESNSTAEDITYSEGVTVKQKIDSILTQLESIGTSAENISYIYTNSDNELVNTNVKAVLDSIRNTLSGVENIGDISTNVQRAETAALNAESSKNTAQALSDAMAASIISANQSFNQLKSDTEDYVDAVKSLIENIDDIANQLNTVFTTSGKFAIMSKTAYDALQPEEIGANTIYFLYN